MKNTTVIQKSRGFNLQESNLHVSTFSIYNLKQQKVKLAGVCYHS